MREEILEWGKVILLGVALSLFIKVFIIDVPIVKGDSMLPTLRDGERLLTNKVIYNFKDPSRGDVVIIKTPKDNYVKRIIGLPGDTIEVRNTSIFINGVFLKQEYLEEDYVSSIGVNEVIEVPDEKYFVMGDNRDVSLDSRNGLGFIERDYIVGKTEMVLFPFKEISLVK